MPDLRHIPPGRAGLLWLRHRLGLAHRGADLLGQKLRILQAERQRFALLAGRTGEAWHAASRDADTWLLRAVLLGGQRAVRLAHDAAWADVDIAWAQSMGVRYPSEATCWMPEPDPTGPPVSNAALFIAADAQRRALQAAVEHAVAEEAVRTMEVEEATTRRRLRAIENRWIPRLELAMAQVRLGIEEHEHAEAVRLRWASGLDSRRIGAASSRSRHEGLGREENPRGGRRLIRRRDPRPVPPSTSQPGPAST